MNIQQLEYFIAVAENRNFTKAAKQCFISQTAMSLQIQELERTLDVKLFDRDKHHVRLTAAGAIYLEKAKEVISTLNEAGKLAKIASQGGDGNITIGFIRGYEHSDISTPLREFHDSFPNISINFIRSNMSLLYEQLERGECDVAYTLLPYYANTPYGLHTKFLKDMPLYLAVYPHHPLAERQNCRYTDLKNEDFIIMQPKGRPKEETEEVLLCHDRGGFIPNIIRWEAEIQTILMSVSIGLGVAIIPAYAIIFYLNAPNLVFIPLVTADYQPETLKFGVCWRDGNQNPVLNKFLSWMNLVTQEKIL